MGEGDLGDYVDPTVTYVPPIPLENRMNDIDPEQLGKYLNPEFMTATPDDKAIDAELLEMANKERIELNLDLNDEELEELEKENMNAAMLAPREYQYELFQKAVKENVIAVLDTGSGKTLISIMLIKHMVALEREARLTRRDTKLAFFLVERVPLVFQQASVIQANCDVTLEQMCGEMEVDGWSEKRWRQIYEDNDICVMTAQIFLDCLYHGFLTMEKVHTLIFDECHHATKRHPFNLIMRTFYDRCPLDKRPKIFGMTASPMHAKTNVESSVLRLEKNLDARVYTASNIEDLNIQVNKPKEITVHYKAAKKFNDTPLTQRIRDKIGSIERYKRCFIVTNNTLMTLGPWCCDSLWKIMLSDLERKMAFTTQDLERDYLFDEDLALKETHELIEKAQFSRNPDCKDPDLFSPKIAMLIQILEIVSKNADFCGIIFVERRHTAVAIKLLIDSLDSLSSFRNDILIGHGISDEGDMQMSFRDQNKIISKFRTGELNLLIATNVAEEGLDIQPCNFVIRFDFFYTLIAYIQSRGRARRADSKYILLVEENNASHAGKIDEFRDLECEMKNFCRLLPEDRNVANKFAISQSINYNFDEDSDSDDEDYLGSAIFIPETGASLTKQNAIPLIHRYCSSLPSDSFCVLKPIFEISSTGEGYVCKLTLPSNAAIQEVESAVCRTKDHARALVALQACSQLLNLKAFDNHLMPKNIRKEILGEMAPQYDENGFIIGSRRRHGLYEKRIPQFWNNVVEEDNEEIGVEDNADLLRANAHNTVAEVSTEDGENTELTAPESIELINTITENDAEMEQVVVTEQEISGPDEEVMLDRENNSTSPMDKKVLEYEMDGMKMLDLDAELTPEELKEQEPDFDEADDALPIETMEGIGEELGEGPFSCWFTIIEVKLKDNKFEEIPYRPLCLISKKPFPDLPELKLFHHSVPFMVNMRAIGTEIVFEREVIQTLSDYMLRLMLALINKEFNCPINDIPYYIVPLMKSTESTSFETLSSEELKQLVDWKEIDSIIEQKMTPYVLDEIEDPEDTVVIDQTDNNRRYFVTKLRTDMSPSSAIPQNVKIRESGYASFIEYYKAKEFRPLEDENQPMLEVKRLKKVMNFLYPGHIVPAQIKGPLSTWTVPEFCQKFFMSASVYQATMMVPSIMTRVDSILLCREAKIRHDLPIDDANFLEAYTCPSASMEMNYERLETLGDSLLKFIATIRLYINFPFSNEGELHHLRIRVICNRALYRSAKRLKFYRYVTSQAFNRRYWRPPHFSSPADNAETIDGLKRHKLSDKTLADIVEASLGAAYLSNGLEGGLHAAIKLQIPFDEIEKWSDFNPTFEESRRKVPPRAETTALRSLNIPKLEEVIGRKFAKPLLLVEALTHASLPNSTAPCYQRLEFLGDAILDFLVIRYLFAKYPDGDPGMITDLKDSCVNNHILGIICLEVGLDKHIIHYSGKLVNAVKFFHNEVQDVKDSGGAVGEYWVDFNVPKVLSDVVESMLGATFVDAGFRLEACEELFEKWFLPILDNHVTPELIRFHPLRKLIQDLQRFGCDGFMLRNHGSGNVGPESQKCVVFLHDKPLACGSDWNIKTARRHAATKASQRLEEEPGLLESVCNCRVSMIKRGLLVEEYDGDKNNEEEDD
ncbi:unnamed protein product [Mucor hiemalis]